MFIIYFIYGIIFGSFYNVIIYRVPNNENFIKGRSYCHNCNKTLKWYDMIPLISYIFLKGKCRYCKVKIGIDTFIIELFTGLLFGLSYYIFGLSILSIYMCVFWSMLLIVGIIDYKTLFIYDKVLLIFFIIEFIFIIILKYNLISSLASGAISFLVYFLIYKISFFVYKKEAFGFGDVLLIFVVAFNLGIQYTVLTIFLPFYIALALYLYAFISKKIDKKEEIPFGPSICISAFIISIFGNELLRLLGTILGII